MSIGREIFTPFPVITNGDMSAQIISKVTIIQKLSMISYDISWSGSSPSGTLSVQVSNTYKLNGQGQVSISGNWQTLTLSNVPTVSGNTGNGFIDVDATGAYAMRLVYNPISGTGSLQATIAAKVA